MKNKIARDRYNIEFKIKYWKQRLQDLQDECPHLNKEESSTQLSNKEYKWYSCLNCGKIWLLENK